MNGSKLAVQPIFIVAQEAITSVVFSPDEPDNCVVLFADAPPQFHCLSLNGVSRAVRAFRRGIAPTEPTMLAEETLLPPRFRSPASHVAYRPGDLTGEVAIVFGQDDTQITRFCPRDPSDRRTVSFLNGSRLAYSADGTLLAAGSTHGQVSVFDLEHEEPAEIVAEQQRGGVKSICFTPGDQRVLFSTDFNSLKSVPLPNYVDEGVTRHVYDLDGEGRVTGMKVNAIARSDKEGLMAVAGVGNDVWVVRSEAECGKMFKLRGFSRIDHLQFLDSRGELLVAGDAGLALVPYTMETGLPVFDEKCERIASPSPRLQVVGAHMYDDLLCAVYQVSS